MFLAVLSLLFTQASAPATIEQDRLTVCLDHAAGDAATAISYASQWQAEANGAEKSYPLQCLGVANTRLLQWEAAENAFVDAREAAPETDLRRRARLGAMAGNAAIPAEHYAEAVNYFSFAVEDAIGASDGTLAGEILTDQSRAFVGLGDLAGASKVLTDARRLSPQNPETWLLSATLARREENLERASAYIATAAELAPKDGDIGVEAGVIAMLAGDEVVARRSWQSVLDVAPGTPAAEQARTYLAQTTKEAGDE